MVCSTADVVDAEVDGDVVDPAGVVVVVTRVVVVVARAVVVGFDDESSSDPQAPRVPATRQSAVSVRAERRIMSTIVTRPRSGEQGRRALRREVLTGANNPCTRRSSSASKDCGMTNPELPVPTVSRLIGVYDADGTLKGELTYWLGARIGRAHCSLCDITHGLVRERVNWRECRGRLPVPFDTYHRDDQPDPVRQTARGLAPVVVVEAGSDMHVLLGPPELEACDGSGDALVVAIEQAVQQRGLLWPE